MLTIACVSDIHLGNKRNSAGLITEALDAAFPDNAETAKIDILFLAGDVFDRLLDLNYEDITYIDLWIARTIRLCAKYDIVLRILEGTPSHDWKQSERFTTMHKVMQLPVDLKYVKELSIEYIERFGIHVLYVPDEWGPSPDDALVEVKEKMRELGLAKVDYACMHGQFEYQLPAHIKNMPRHDSAQYLDLVKHYIFIGHIHTHSRYQRIVAQGSFDRLKHNEEEAKGHVRSRVGKGVDEVFFIENKLARRYVNIKCYGLSSEESLRTIATKIESLPWNACVRIEAEKNNPIFGNMNEVVRLSPTFTWSKLPKDQEEEEQEAFYEEQEDDFIPITITRDNIESLITPRLTKLGFEEPDLLRSITLLNELR